MIHCSGLHFLKHLLDFPYSFQTTYQGQCLVNLKLFLEARRSKPRRTPCDVSCSSVVSQSDASVYGDEWSAFRSERARAIALWT